MYTYVTKYPHKKISLKSKHVPCASIALGLVKLKNRAFYRRPMNRISTNESSRLFTGGPWQIPPNPPSECPHIIMFTCWFGFTWILRSFEFFNECGAPLGLEQVFRISHSSRWPPQLIEEGRKIHWT